MDDNRKQIRLNEEDQKAWGLIADYLKENMGFSPDDSTIMRYALHMASIGIKKDQQSS